MDGIEMVFFDAGGTLLVPREDVGEVYAHTAARYGLEAEPEAILKAFFRAFHAQKTDGRPQDRAWWREVVRRTFASFGEPSDPEALFEDLYTHFTAPASWILVQGARETLETLHARGYRTGLISNWDDRLPAILNGLGLAPLLDPVVISCEVGAEKPDARIYEAALSRAGVAPARALMVGDDYEADVEGALARGMGAVQVRRHGQRHNGEIVVDRLTDVLDLLAPRDGEP